MRWPILFRSPLRMRSAARPRWAVSLEKPISTGLKPGPARPTSIPALHTQSLDEPRLYMTTLAPEHIRRRDAGQTQACGERRGLSVIVQNNGAQAPATPKASITIRHADRHPGFIDEDQPCGGEIGLAPRRAAACLRDISYTTSAPTRDHRSKDSVQNDIWNRDSHIGNPR